MNPRIEEVSESESDYDSEPSEVDISDAQALIRPSHIPASSPAPAPQPQGPAVQVSVDQEKSKHYQCLYPVYFDSARTRAEGRRVGSELAVANPLAREMADAAASLGLRTVFEPEKTHPKDWSNPGRVRVLLKKDGQPLNRNVKNKHHLYILMSQYLKDHPTRKNTPLRLQIPGLPVPKEPLPVPAVPRGWKMNSILPLHSPALTGGGVSENFLQDMMAEMQGGAAGGAGPSAAIAGAEGKQKKDKKKK